MFKSNEWNETNNPVVFDYLKILNLIPQCKDYSQSNNCNLKIRIVAGWFAKSGNLVHSFNQKITSLTVLIILGKLFQDLTASSSFLGYFSNWVPSTKLALLLECWSRLDDLQVLFLILYLQILRYFRADGSFYMTSTLVIQSATWLNVLLLLF